MYNKFKLKVPSLSPVSSQKQSHPLPSVDIIKAESLNSFVPIISCCPEGVEMYSFSIIHLGDTFEVVS